MKISTVSFLIAQVFLLAAISVHVHRFGAALKKVGPGHGWSLPMLSDSVPIVTVPVLIGLAVIAMLVCVSATRTEKRRQAELSRSEVE